MTHRSDLQFLAYSNTIFQFASKGPPTLDLEASQLVIEALP